MFGFLSALVEKGIFERISVNFLIVGHTHASIDQYFSVLSKTIKNADWIGTPLALRELLRGAHEVQYQPKVIAEINVYYDWKEPINKAFNNKLKVRIHPQLQSYNMTNIQFLSCAFAVAPGSAQLSV